MSLGLFCQIIVYFGQTLRLGPISNFEIELYRTQFVRGECSVCVCVVEWTSRIILVSIYYVL